MKLKTIIILLLVLMLIPFLSNNSYSELGDRYIVLGVAIDFDFNKDLYLLTVEVINNEESSAGSVVSKYYTGSGKSLFDAVRNIVKSSGKKMSWAHTKIIIINKDLAAKGIYRILDWINRDHEIRNNILPIISHEETAKEIIECKSSKFSIPSNIISEMIDSFSITPKYPKIDLWKFSHDLSTSGIEPITPAIKLVQSDGSKKLEIAGTAVFLNDLMLGFLDDYESMDLLIVRNQLKGGLLYLDKSSTNLDSDILFEIFSSSTKLKSKLNDTNLIVEINVKPKLGLAESGKPLDFSNEKVFEALGKSSNSYLEKRISRTIKTVQEKFKSDIFGLGNNINISFPDYWKDVKSEWNKNFSNLEFYVKVDAQISGSGVVLKPLKKE